MTNTEKVFTVSRISRNKIDPRTLYAERCERREEPLRIFFQTFLSYPDATRLVVVDFQCVQIH